jgi:tRNA pseudouridine38-40 synthase
VPTCLLTFAYDGKSYRGWQRQAGEDTVQQRLEGAFAAIFAVPVAVEGAGRTDAGVHAFGQTAHAVLPRAFPLDRLVPALNANLPDTIAVRAVRGVPDGFHARFHAVGKRYVYRCVATRVRPAIGRDHFHWVRRSLDLGPMRAAGALLLGRHDFAAFASNPGYVRKRGTVRTLQHLHLRRRPWGFDLAVQGDGFLYNMVRAIAGTLIDVGTGRLGIADVAAILHSRDRRQGGPVAPACGLYLLRVIYAADLPPAAACVDPDDDVS